MPKVSSDGKTYTFTIRPGLKFNTGEVVTAATFAHAINRDLSPQLQSPAQSFLADVVGVQAVLSKKTKTASGVKANGNTLTIRLTKVAPDFVARIAMPFFCAVPLGHRRRRRRARCPGAGPYYVASRTPNRLVVVKRNPNYHGPRPHHYDLISVTANANGNQSLLQRRSGEADYDLGPLPPESVSGLAKQYGINKGQFWVHTANIVYYAALNTRRLDLAARKAINFAIDRPALARQAGALAGEPTDQILPPTLNGFRDAKIYPLNGPDATTARKLMKGRTLKANLYTATDPTAQAQAQVFVANLKAIGISVNVKALPFAALNRADRRPERALRPRPQRLVRGLPRPGRLHQHPARRANIHSQNNVNVPLMNVPRTTRGCGRPRCSAAMPATRRTGGSTPTSCGTSRPGRRCTTAPIREFLSSRVGCYVYQPAQGGMDLAAACPEVGTRRRTAPPT